MKTTVKSLVPSLVRWTGTCLTLSLIGTLCQAEDTGAVTVRDFTITPGGNLTALDNTLEIHPKAMIGGAYDSNLYDSPNGQKIDGGFGTGTLGLDLRWLPTREDKVTVGGEVSTDRYPRNSDRTMNSGVVTAKVEHDGPAIGANLAGSAGRYIDPLVETGQRIPRNQYNANGLVGYKTLTSNYAVGGTYDRDVYLEPFGAYGLGDRDNSRYSGFLRYGYQYAEASESYVRGIASTSRYNTDTLTSGAPGFNDSTGVAAVAGWRGLIGAKTSLFAEAGAEHRTYSDNFGRDVAYDDKSTTQPVGLLGATYAWEERSQVELRGSSEIRDSLTANSALYLGGALSARQRVLTKAGVFAGASAYRFRDLSSGANDPEQRINSQVDGGLEYYLRDGYALRLKAAFETSHARLGESYERFTTGIDLAVAL